MINGGVRWKKTKSVDFFLNFLRIFFSGSIIGRGGLKLELPKMEMITERELKKLEEIATNTFLIGNNVYESSTPEEVNE